MSAQGPMNQLLFNLNPTLQPPPLPTSFNAPEPIVINKFSAVSFLLSFADVYEIRCSCEDS